MEIVQEYQHKTEFDIPASLFLSLLCLLSSLLDHRGRNRSEECSRERKRGEGNRDTVRERESGWSGAKQDRASQKWGVIMHRGIGDEHR